MKVNRWKKTNKVVKKFWSQKLVILEQKLLIINCGNIVFLFILIQVKNLICLNDYNSVLIRCMMDFICYTTDICSISFIAASSEYKKKKKKRGIKNFMFSVNQYR
jgi:hypothetical protein